MMPMTSNGIASAVTGMPVAPSSNTPNPPAKPIAIEPMRAPNTIAPKRMRVYKATNMVCAPSLRVSKDFRHYPAMITPKGNGAGVRLTTTCPGSPLTRKEMRF